MATELLPDDVSLRRGRRQRALDAMAAHDLDVLVLGRPANVRYVAGAPLLWNAGNRAFGPGCVLVRSTGAVFLLATWDEGVPDDIPHENLYGITWNPMNLVGVLREIGATTSATRVGTDAISPLFARLLPTAFPDAELVDGERAMHEARRTKIDAEVEAIRGAIQIAEVALEGALAELGVGATERQLNGAFMEAMARQGVTTPATQDVARITTTGGERGVVRSGDLVSFHAAVVAGGYTGEVGRTWPVGDPGPGARSLFERAATLRDRLVDSCRVGVAGSAFFDVYDAADVEVPSCAIVRGLGLGFDEPVLLRELPETAARERLASGDVVVVTAHVADATSSVTTHDAVLVTPSGPELLTSAPSWAG